MKKSQHIASIGISLCAAAVLVACGGGDGGGGGGSTAAPASVPAVTIALPAAPVGTPADATTNGTLPMLAFDTTLTGSMVNAVISGAGAPPSVMTFTAPAFTLTGADTATPVWGTNGGVVKAGGNVVMYCDVGLPAAFDTAVSTNNTPFEQGGHLFISANLETVSDASVLRGLTIKTETCAKEVITTTYNADGTSTRVDPSGTTALNATQTAAFFSAAGFTGGGGSNHKVRVYKRVSGGTTRYFTVTLVDQVGPASKFVGVGYQP